MDLAGYSHGFAALAYSVFAASLVRTGLARRGGGAAQLTFGIAVAASAAWGWMGLFAHLSGGGPALAIGTSLLDLTRYGAWFVFALVLLRSPDRAARSPATALLERSAAAVVVFGMLLFAAALFAERTADSVRHLPLASLLLPVLGLVLVEQLFRNVSDDGRWQIKPLCLGLACIFVFDVYLHSHALLFGQFDQDSVVIRGLVHSLAVPLLYLASKRHRDWAGPFQMSRNAAFHTATLVLVGAYLLVISAIGYYVRHVGGDWGRALELALLCAALVFLALLVFSGALRAKVRVFIGKNFFRYRYDYRSEWLRFTSMLTVEGSPREVGRLVIRGLADMLHSNAGGLWSIDSGGTQLVQTARWNVAQSAHKEPADSPFSRFLGEREWVIDLDECRSHPERYADAQMPAWLLEGAQEGELFWLVVPLIVGDRLTGFVVLARPHAPQHVNWEVRDLLKTASRQAAGFMALMHATEALLDVRKFDAFNRMSAFVVHDLKNIVAQLSLMMQNARRLKDNPEFQEDMLTTVESSLEKMRRLMLQLREGSAPAGVSSGVALPPIFERIEAAAAARGRAMEVQVVDAVVTRGHDQRIERVLSHLVDNALDATAAAGSVRVTLGRSGSQAKIVVSDTGEGMSQEFIHTRLFKPFRSTKPSGMGIGAYESFQYIKELGGSLSVDSVVGRGTVMTVLLPLFDARQGSDLELDCAE